jgi:hypothetical protein
MISNLKTTLRAYPRLSSSMIGNFATKSELDSFVTKTEFYNTISQFVKQIENPIQGIVYARANGQWVPVAEMETPITGALCYGYVLENHDADPGTLTEEEFNSLNRTELSDSTEYLVSITPEINEKGYVYLYFCCTSKISKVLDISFPDAPVDIELTNCGTRTVVVDNDKELELNCYSVPSMAFPGATMEFKIIIEENK